MMDESMKRHWRRRAAVAVALAAAVVVLTKTKIARNLVEVNAKNTLRKKLFSRLHSGTDVSCFNQLRMNRSSFETLCNLLIERGLLRDTKNIAVRESLSMFLNILAHNKKFRDVGGTFLRSTDTISRHFNTVLVAILKLGPDFIKLPASGWKSVAYTAAIQALKDDCDVVISKEKIMARIKTWNKYYQEISAMLDTSGFGWDWERNVVKVDSEDVWANYVQAHPTVKHYRSKVIVNWGDLAMICGIDRATGAHAATATEAVNEIHIDDSVDENVEEEIEPQVSKKKKTSAVDKIADAVSSIARNLEHESTVSSQPTPLISRADRIYAAIAAIPDLSEEEIIQAIDMLSVDETKSDVFMALPVPIRRTWLRIHLLD